MNAKIAVIDTGYDFISGKSEISNSVTVTSGYQDTVGHGTAMVDEIVNISPDAEIYIVKANQENSNRFTDAGLIKAFDWAIQQDVDVINVSLSAAGSAPKELIDVVIKAVDAGIHVIASAGNSYPNKIGYIANIDGVIGVGAAIYDERYKNSQDGEYLDLYASNYTLIERENCFGTSISTAIVSGTIGEMMRIGKDADDIYDYLLPMPGGGGKLNVKFAINSSDKPVVDSFNFRDEATVSYLIPEQEVKYDIAVSVSHQTNMYDLTQFGDFVLDSDNTDRISFYNMGGEHELIGNLFGYGGVYDYINTSKLDDGLYIIRVTLFDTETHNQIQDTGVSLLMI